METDGVILINPIHAFRFGTMNSYTYEIRYQNRIFLYEIIYMNSYSHFHIWIHIDCEFIWIHIDYEFIWSFHLLGFVCIWICLHMNIYIYIYISYKLWIHIIISYMNTYNPRIHIWIGAQVWGYHGSRWFHVLSHDIIHIDPKKKTAMSNLLKHPALRWAQAVTF